MTARFARRMDQVKPNAIGELLKHGADPAVISFAGGYPDPGLFPVEELRQVFDDLFTGGNRDALQYTVSDGLPSLREHVAARMVRDGVACTAQDVLILQGVAYVPGGTFFPVVQEPNHARLNYSGVSHEKIVTGITRLGELLRATLGR